MGASVRPDPVADYLQARGSDPVAEYLAAKGATSAPTKPPPTSGAGWAAHVLNIAQGIPGVERLEATAGAIGNGIPYEQSLKALREITGGIGGKTAAAERFAGSLAALPFLPANPAIAGAVLGGADQALSADPASLAERAGKTALGTAGGAAVGKALDLGVTAARSVLAKTPAANLLDRAAQRSASANTNYAKALAEGVGKPATPQVQAFLAQPDVAEIVTELQSTRPFAGVPADDPKMLDAIYKTLSDRGAAVKKGLDAVSPNKPNIGRFRAADIKAAQSDALDAISGGTIPGPMPSYRNAVADFAEKSAGMDAVKQGVKALKTASGNSPSVNALLKSTPEAFAKWAATATDAQKEAAAQGILGELKTAGRMRAGNILGTPLVPMPTKALRQAPGLLRMVEPNGSLVAKLSLLGLNSP